MNRYAFTFTDPSDRLWESVDTYIIETDENLLDMRENHLHLNLPRLKEILRGYNNEIDWDDVFDSDCWYIRNCDDVDLVFHKGENHDA